MDFKTTDLCDEFFDLCNQFSDALQIAEPVFGEAELVMVYHRLPYDELVVDGVTLQRRPKSPNGIMPTLLNFFAGGRKGSWVAWSQQASR